MNTVCCDSVTFDGSLLASDIVVETAAGRASVTSKTATEPGATRRSDGRIISPASDTDTFAVAWPRFVAEAVITAEPIATPVTGTVVLEVFCGTRTVGGTVAAAVLLEFRLIVRPPFGAGPLIVTVRFFVSRIPTVRFCGARPMLPVTVTEALACPYPDAAAVIFAAPGPTPATRGCCGG
jgi:hypothetical protein